MNLEKLPRFLFCILLFAAASTRGEEPSPPDTSHSDMMASSSEATPALAKRAFERLKALEGTWTSASTKGWAGEVTYQRIARDSVLLGTSRVDPHGDELMATAYHLDGDRLVLTHYCVAGNQPQLEATEIQDDGRHIIFTFRDATGIASRDEGHMDKAIFQLVDDDRFTSRWTWYEKGTESWLEEIEHQRTDRDQ